MNLHDHFDSNSDTVTHKTIDIIILPLAKLYIKLIYNNLFDIIF